MPKRPNWIVALTAVALLSAVIASPVAAAKPVAPKVPTFDVTVTPDRVSGFGEKVYVGFEFTSTSPKRARGFARLVSPLQAYQTNYVFWTPALQNTDSSAAGYFRIGSNTCQSATLSAFHGMTIQEEQWIDVAFDCQPGQSFLIHWFPEGRWYDIDAPHPSDDDWDFPVSTRTTVKNPWTPQAPAHVVVGVSQSLVSLPSNWITRPAELIEVEVVTPPVPMPYIVLEATGTFTVDVRPVSETLTLVNPVRADNGEAVLVANPEVLLIERTIEVQSCVPVDWRNCELSPFGDVVLSNAPGAFTDLSGGALPNDVGVIFGVSTVVITQGFDVARAKCLWYGANDWVQGTNLDNFLWTCTFATGAANFETAAGTLSSPTYCPSGQLIRADDSMQFYKRIICLK